ncbi:MAG: hypothetical protein A2Y40_09105 [Candidatus Margulisbacteria bacterium GWF2_35_9]|nr:MAG: hypothetical protein A2Y40_09105 [Candidatus Margulisbacteria bacterium GWF2_35_9]
MAKQLIPLLECGKNVFFNTTDSVYSTSIFQIVREKIVLPDKLLFSIWFIALSNQLIPKTSYEKSLKQKQEYKCVWDSEKILNSKIKKLLPITGQEFKLKSSFHVDGTCLIFLDKKGHIQESGVLMCSDQNQLFVVYKDKMSFVKIMPIGTESSHWSYSKIVPVSSADIMFYLGNE